MKESEELKLKNSVASFIRENFILEGRKDLIEIKIKDLTIGIYEIFYPTEGLK